MFTDKVMITHTKLFYNLYENLHFNIMLAIPIIIEHTNLNNTIRTSSFHNFIVNCWN